MNNSDILDEIRAMAEDAGSILANVVALLHRKRSHYHWVGIYLLKNKELILGPYVGKPTIHVQIPLHQGICGAAASSGETLVIHNVQSDPRYLACSLETRSEIVVPIKRGRRVLGEIDIDSHEPAAFTDDDRELLEAIASLLANKIDPAAAQ